MTSPPQQPPIVPGPPLPADPTHLIQAPVIVKKIHPLSWVILGVGVLALICGVFAAVGSFAGNPTAGASPSPYPVYVQVTPTAYAEAPAPTAPAAPTTTTKPPPPPPPQIDDGVWTVGTDVPAGRYRTTTSVSSDCYWAITKTGTNGDDIIANDIPGGGRPQVTLKRGQDFNTQRCGTWVKVG